MKTKSEIQKEALIAIGDKRLAGVDMTMGVGKTLVGIKDMARNYASHKKYLIVAPKKAIFESWISDLKEFNFLYLLPHITFTTYRSLHKETYDYDNIYLDECHSLKGSHNKWLYAYVQQGGRLLGLTGTYPVGKKSEKAKMCNFYTPKVFEYTIDQAIEDGILNNYEIYVHMLELNKEPTIVKQGKHGEFKTSELSDYQYWSRRIEESDTAQETQMLRIQRMKYLQMFKTKEEYAADLFKLQTEQTLLFANTKDQADVLCKATYHSGNPKSKIHLKAFSLGRIPRLAAVEQLSEGVNIPGLRVGIIMHAYSNNRKTAQKIGRMLRLNPKDTATIHILCYTNSVDKEWVTSALEKFDQTKIHWVKKNK